jgi:hypothetical protein
LLLFLDKNLTTIDRPRRRCAQDVQALLQGHPVVADVIVDRARRSRPDVVARFGVFDAVIPLCCIAIFALRWAVPRTTKRKDMHRMVNEGADAMPVVASIGRLFGPPGEEFP